MRFQVPQFIEVEDKIFGPFTLKQFIYLAGGSGLCFVIYTLVPYLWLALVLMSPVVILSLALAFYPVNNKPFIYILEAAFKYVISNKLYIWKKEEKKAVPKEDREIESLRRELTVPKLSQSKLKDLTWSLDINESIYSNKNQR